MPAARIVTGCDVVDNAHFAPAQALRKSTGCRVLTVARLVPEKNLLAAASAFIRFAASRTPAEKWVWTIVGYGPQQERLERVAETAGGKIELRGYVSYDRMPEVYGAADLYWQPSVSEPWGLVVNEAMASGLPVLVSTQCGCAQDLVSPQVGWTFDPTSDDGLIDGLRRAAEGRPAWREMGADALKTIADWDLDRFARGALLAAQAALAHAKSRNAHR
jgi:glycosyltransferase involved in cell wall biosynthesis